jgi:glycosyltransferase involved in cell wall biosynthesis
VKIAIQAADLDHSRIDGTRVYIKNLLKYLGTLDTSSEFLIFHKNEFNPELAPKEFPNYRIIQKPWPLFWTQMRLSHSLWKERPDILWMPMHNIPYFLPKGIKTVVTIHDLAFKYFPEMFTLYELWKLNFLAKLAIEKSDGIITISESSKSDILKFYPQVSEDKIKVISHGFDGGVYAKKRDLKKEKEIKKSLEIDGKYLLYIGALQPRKNLGTLIEAFEKIKIDEKYKDLELVLAGEKAWMWKEIFEKIEASPYKKDISTPGKIKFEDIGHLMRGAEVFCFPSLYEGFGIPILEAFAAGVPVVCARNSSLPEVGGEAALYFDGKNSGDLAEKIKTVLSDGDLRKNLMEKGKERSEYFSWKRCAEETLGRLKIFGEKNKTILLSQSKKQSK